MRALFVIYAAGITAGLAFAIVVGLEHSW